MLTFSKRDFTQRLHDATVNLLNLAVAAKEKPEQHRLFDKRSGVENCLAWWFSITLDSSEVEAYDRLSDLREWCESNIRILGENSSVSEGYKLVLSYIDEY